MEITETTLEEKAWEIQDVIHAKNVQEAEDSGRPTVVAKDIEGIPDGTIGIVAMFNGVPDYNAQVTWMYCPPQKSPDDTYYIPSLPQVEMEAILEEVPGELYEDYVCRELPPEYEAAVEESVTGTAPQPAEFGSQFDQTEFNDEQQN